MNSTLKSSINSNFKSNKHNLKEKDLFFVDPEVMEKGYNEMALIK